MILVKGCKILSAILEGEITKIYSNSGNGIKRQAPHSWCGASHLPKTIPTGQDLPALPIGPVDGPPEDEHLAEYVHGQWQI